MQLGERLAPDVVYAAWLAAELPSERFGARVREELAKAGAGETLITHPDLGAVEENRLRRALLHACRYGYYGDWLYELSWYRALLEPAEVLEVRYINWDWWLEISGGTRMPLDGAAWERRNGSVLRFRPESPPLICVRADPRSHLVVLEGHVRLTALAMDPETIPSPLEILLGEGEAVRSWGCY